MNNPDLSNFAKYIPGFEFLHNLTRQAASGAAPGATSAVPGMPPMSHWVAPTFDVEELDKRIQDLRAVHFWLDQNTKALAATIQALEVQKMTLATLKGMNVSLAEMADAFKIRPEVTEPPVADAKADSASEAASADAPPDQTDEDGEDAAARPQVDPMQWWHSLTDQFQTIAAGAVRDMADQASKAAEQMTQVVQATAAQAAAAQGAEPATEVAPSQRARRAPATKATAKTKASKTPKSASGANGSVGNGKAGAPAKAATKVAARKPRSSAAATRSPEAGAKGRRRQG